VAKAALFQTLESIIENQLHSNHSRLS